jgi:hypothetical protein
MLTDAIRSFDRLGKRELDFKFRLGVPLAPVETTQRNKSSRTRMAAQ